MIEASCHCGAVRLELETAPTDLNDCGCSICRRKGTLWAYYSPTQVRIIPASGATHIYMWGDRDLEFHSCKVCACTTHWSSVDTSYDRMGINARLMAPEIVAQTPIRKSGGA